MVKVRGGAVTYQGCRSSLTMGRNAGRMVGEQSGEFVRPPNTHGPQKQKRKMRKKIRKTLRMRRT